MSGMRFMTFLLFGLFFSSLLGGRYPRTAEGLSRHFAPLTFSIRSLAAILLEVKGKIRIFFSPLSEFPTRVGCAPLNAGTAAQR